MLTTNKFRYKYEADKSILKVEQINEEIERRRDKSRKLRQRTPMHEKDEYKRMMDKINKEQFTEEFMKKERQLKKKQEYEKRLKQLRKHQKEIRAMQEFKNKQKIDVCSGFAELFYLLSTLKQLILKFLI